MSITGVDANSANSVHATDPAAAQSAYPPGFAYSSQQYRVVFGAGSAARLNEEVERLGIRRVLVLTTREQRDQGARLGAHLGSRLAELFSDARMHTPVEVTEAGHRSGPGAGYRRLRCDRRRFDDRARQGAVVAHRASPYRHAHHLCRIGNDADPR